MSIPLPPLSLANQQGGDTQAHNFGPVSLGAFNAPAWPWDQSGGLVGSIAASTGLPPAVLYIGAGLLAAAIIRKVGK